VNFSKLEEMFQRADRFRKRLKIKDGEGTAWSHTFDNNEIHYYSLNGVKPPEEIKDELESAFVWLWSLKDHVKKYVIAKGKTKEWVESRVNADPYLCICADLANSPKHGGLDRKPRSNKNPRLGNLKYNIPQQAMSQITVGAFDVGMNIGDPSLISLEWPVLGDEDKYLGDALKYLEYGLKAWEGIINEANRAV
jgi:hypothetical protein